MIRATWPGAALLLVAVLAASPASAQPGPSTGDQQLAEASRLVASGELDRALAAIDAGLRTDQGHQGLLRLRAEVLVEKRQFEAALAAYQAYLATRPTGADRRKARQMVKDLAAIKTTFLFLAVAPSPAVVYLDAKKRGVFCEAKPTCRKGVLPGPYQLIVERPGYDPAVRNVEVAPNQETRVEIKLTEQRSVLTLDVRPANATVEIDGKAVAERRVTIDPGTHYVRVSAEGFEPQKVEITAALGEPTSVSVTLIEMVRVVVTPETAELALDGEPVTLDNGALPIPADGRSRVLAVSAEGYNEQLVQIAADRIPGRPIEIELEKLGPLETPEPKPREQVEPEILVVSPSVKGRLAAAFFLGATAAGVGLGTYLGLQARDQFEQSKAFCTDNVCRSREGVELVKDAKQSARYSDIAFASAGGALVIGVVLWLSSQSPADARLEAERELKKVTGSSSKPRAQLRIDGAPDRLGLRLEGRF